MTYRIRCLKDGKTYFAYNGLDLSKERAEAEAKGIERQWPNIKTEVVPKDEPETERK